MYQYNENGQKVPMSPSKTKVNSKENFSFKTKKSKLYLGLILLVVLLVVLALVWYYKKSNKASASFGCGMSPANMGMKKFGFRFY